MTVNHKYHVPVMLEQCLDGLNIHPEGVYIDATFGGGGHARAIQERLSASGRLIAFDQDPDAKENSWDASNFDFVSANFSFISNHLRLLGVGHVDGILADLGVSSWQFDQASRGFSIRTKATLDMRMNQHGTLTAQTIVNDYDETNLLRVFRSYGEIPNAKRLTNELVSARLSQKIETTEQLSGIARKCAPQRKENKYLAQVFQALRIEVNDEMHALEQLLLQCEKIVRPNGRLVVMSYHSLEDRMVKNFMKRGAIDGEVKKDFFGNVLKPFTEVIRKPIMASAEEIKINNRARSAKLRIAERNGE